MKKLVILLTKIVVKTKFFDLQYLHYYQHHQYQLAYSEHFSLDLNFLNLMVCSEATPKVLHLGCYDSYAGSQTTWFISQDGHSQVMVRRSHLSCHLILHLCSKLVMDHLHFDDCSVPCSDYIRHLDLYFGDFLLSS